MKKTIITSTLLAGLTLSGAALATDMRIYFEGRITEEAMELPDDGSLGRSYDLLVLLGTFNAASINGSAGNQTTPVPFPIKLQNCPMSLEGQEVFASFTGTRDAQNPELLEIDPTMVDSAYGVGVVLGDTYGNTVPLDLVSSPATTFTIANNSASLTYTARYMSTMSDIRAGKARAVADVTIHYPEGVEERCEVVPW